MNMDSNPLEAGLDPFVRLDKGAEFIGKAALKDVLREGLSRKLGVLRVDSSAFNVDPEGNESVWCCDKVSFPIFRKLTRKFVWEFRGHFAKVISARSI